MGTRALPLDPHNARRALDEACKLLGFDATDAELIRLGENAVFRLRHRSVIARVMRSPDRLQDAAREVSVARWLASEGVPAIRLIEVPQPISVAGRVVTLWESAADRTEYGTPAELADLLRRLHSLPCPDEIMFPVLHPFDRARDRIEQVSSLRDDDRDFLSNRCEILDAEYRTLQFELPMGVIHGDANVGNVIRDRHGRTLLADLDGFANGPREWDLILTAIYYEQFGWHTEAEYEEFVRHYGWDVMRWDGYPVLRSVREFLMVTWLAQNAQTDAKARVELDKRLASLRRGSSRRDWLPF